MQVPFRRIYQSYSFFLRFDFIKMTILGKIDNGEHLNIDRDDYFDHDERDQILRHFTILTRGVQEQNF